MVQADEAALQLFIAHQQLAEPVKPTVRNLNHPSSGSLVRVICKLIRFLPTAFDVRYVTMLLNQFQRGISGISSICAPVRRAALGWHFSLYHDLLQHGTKLRYIMPVRPGYDE